MTIGEVSIRFRERLGIDRERAARMLGVATEALEGFELGHVTMPVAFGNRYHNAFGVSLYSFGACFCINPSDLPEGVVAPSQAMIDAAKPEIEATIAKWREQHA